MKTEKSDREADHYISLRMSVKDILNQFLQMYL